MFPSLLQSQFFKTVSSRKDREGKCCTMKMEGNVLAIDSAIQVLSHKLCVLASLLLSLSLCIHVVGLERVWDEQCPRRQSVDPQYSSML